MRGTLIVNGFLKRDGTQCCIVNVYAPCAKQDKVELWDAFKILIDQNSDVCVCVIGDFNTIRFDEERIWRSSGGDSRDKDIF